MNGVNWEYYKKFEELNNKYLPDMGEGNNKAEQTVVAINKLVYKWYNDGDVYDNTYNLEGWANDLSSYANWLEEYIEGADKILSGIFYAKNEDDYELILQALADTFLTEKGLEKLATQDKVGSIYECEGSYKFEEYQEEDDEEIY